MIGYRVPTAAARGGSSLRSVCGSVSVSVMIIVIVGVSGTGCGPADAPGGAQPSAASDVAEAAGVADRLTVRGWAPPVARGFRAVVLLTPEDGHDVDGLDEAVRMDQFGLSFHPGVLVARAGQEVAFTNGDDVLHNVHVSDSATRDTVFNIATPIAGAYLHVFERPGTYTVSCDVHPAMAAHILVTEAPYAAVAERDGRFELSGVPAGLFVVNVWSVDAALRSERRMTIGPETELRLYEEGEQPD